MSVVLVSSSSIIVLIESQTLIQALNSGKGLVPNSSCSVRVF